MSNEKYKVADYMVKKYYTFRDEFGYEVGIQFCDEEIKRILITYSREQWIRFLGHLSSKFLGSSALQEIMAIQNEILNIPVHQEIVIFHKQAINACFQYLFSIAPEEYSKNNKLDNRDVFLLFILINQSLELHETSSKQLPLGKKILYGNFKTIQFTQDNADIRATMGLFQRFNQQIKMFEDKSYDSLIYEKFGIGMDELIAVLNIRDGKTLFRLFERFVAIRDDELYHEWISRIKKVAPPQDIYFMKKHPLIKINEDLILTDFNNLIELVFRLIYETLFQSFPSDFKPKFGGEIVEPVIKDTLRTMFITDTIKEIRITTNTYQYADFGLIDGTDIYLFEIKSTCLNYATLYVDDIHVFFKKLNDRFVNKEGVMQQVKKIKRINDEPDHFYSIASLDQNIQYTIHPVLIVFEEVFQAFCSNWYFSTRFDILRRICKVSPDNVKLSHHITLTFNELFRLNEISHTDKLELLNLYSQKILPHSFSFFLQEANIK